MQQSTDLPDPKKIGAHAQIYGAISIIGALHAEMLTLAWGYPDAWNPDPEKLRDLAKRVARDGMAASRRLRKAEKDLR